MWAYRNRASIARKVSQPANVVYLKGAESDELPGGLIARSVNDGSRALDGSAVRISAHSGGDEATLKVGEARQPIGRVADESLELAVWVVRLS